MTTLQSDGWAIVPTSVAPTAMKAVKACSELPLTFTSANGKKFLKKIFKEGCENIPSEAYTLAEHPDVLAVVEEYFGKPAKVQSLRLFYTQFHRTEPKKSQLWHCDRGPLQTTGYEPMVKLFLYCTDVDVENGPFTFYPAKESETLWNVARYDTSQRLVDSDVQHFMGQAAPIQMLGPAGKAFLVDSAKCFHFGARIQRGAKPRLMLVVQYTPISD